MTRSAPRVVARRGADPDCGTNWTRQLPHVITPLLTPAGGVTRKEIDSHELVFMTSWIEFFKILFSFEKLIPEKLIWNKQIQAVMNIVHQIWITWLFSHDLMNNVHDIHESTVYNMISSFDIDLSIYDFHIQIQVATSSC